MTDFAHFPRPGENYPYEHMSMVLVMLGDDDQYGARDEAQLYEAENPR